MSQASEPHVAKIAFEEYQLYYESIERVTDRRLAGNNWNYSICTAVLVVIAVAVNWALAHPNFFAAGIVLVVVLSIMAVLFCSLWVGQIRDAKKLNAAKFEVFNAMAPSVAFSDSPEDDRVSYCPWDREWQIMHREEAVREVSSINIVALKASNIEYLIPKAFRFLFVLITLLALISVILNWDVFVNSLSLDVTTKHLSAD